MNITLYIRTNTDTIKNYKPYLKTRNYYSIANILEIFLFNYVLL